MKGVDEMGRKSNKIEVRLFIPDESGGYRLFEELNPEERAAFSKKSAQRMGKEINDWYSTHPEQIESMLRSIDAQ